MPILPDKTNAVDLLVVGHAGFIAINRNVYSRLAARGWNVELAIPEFIPSLESRRADPRRPEDLLIHWLRVRGGNQRFWRFEGIGAILDQRRPRAIFLEADPASVLAIQLSRWARKHKVSLFCYTNENLIRPFWQSVVRRDVAAAVRMLRSSGLTLFTRDTVKRVFVLCNAAAASMQVLGFGDRVFKMPLGFDPDVFCLKPDARAATRAQHGLRDPVIAYIGRVVPGKGIEFLIEALAQLTDLEWHFLIDDFSAATACSYGDRIRRQLAADSRLMARTQTFHADHFQVADYFNAVDIVVAPSCLPEQYGRVLAEAMACGKVVVATDAGAYPELVGDAGIIVPQANSAALASALRSLLLDSPLAGKLGSKALARARSELSMEVQVDILDRHLRAVLRPQA